MKYLLMIIMVLSCIGISYLLNKSKRNREYILSEIKNSTKVYDISQYIDSISTSRCKYVASLKRHLDDLAQDRASVSETHDNILKAMPNIFNKNNDSAFIMKYLHAVTTSANPKIREAISLRCEKLIAQNKDEIKTNIYIAIAIAVILVILAV